MHVLIVDDAPATLGKLRALIEAAGCTVSTAHDGIDALAVLAGTKVDGIISDVLMPRLDGYRLCQEVRANPDLAATPFLFHTAAALSPEEESFALELGADGFLKGPAQGSIIVATLRAAGASARRQPHSSRSRPDVEEIRRHNESLVAKLEQKHIELQLLLESTGEGIYGTNGEGQCTFINKAGAAMLGYSPEELLGKDTHVLVHHTRRDGSPYPPEECPILGTLRKGQHCRVDTDVFWRRDGTCFPVEYSAHPVIEAGVASGAVITFSDISQRRETEDRIREQADLLDLAHDAILVRDCNGAIRYWNRGAERLYGWSQAEAIGQDGKELLRIDEALFAKASEQLLKHGSWQGELPQVTKDRRELVISSGWTLLRDTLGKPKSVLVIDTDITERKAIEAQALRSQRLESLGTLAGGIAHDLNNALAPVFLVVELLREKLPNPADHHCLDTLGRSAERATDMVRQILMFARGVQGERIPIHIRALLAELGKIVEQLFPKSIRIQSSLPNSLWTVTGDVTQLHQVFLNLCVNARDAMPNGGTLTLRAQNLSLDEQFAHMHPEAQAGPYVIIEVSDTGVGMAPAVLEHIFEPFFTTKLLGEGTGLGLPTVRTIVRSHGGFVTVHSEQDKGTRFTVHLPARAAKPGATADCTPVVAPSGDGEVIIVVDDEESVRDVLTETLRLSNYAVLPARDGAEAIALYVQNRERVRLVLTDLIMPSIDGKELIRALRGLSPDLKIVVSSGLGEEFGSPDASALPVQAVLQKPYTASMLLETVHTVLYPDD